MTITFCILSIINFHEPSHPVYNQQQTQENFVWYSLINDKQHELILITCLGHWNFFQASPVYFSISYHFTWAYIFKRLNLPNKSDD